MSAAVALARAGWQVSVREAADTIGGGTRTAALTLPGFLHDVCSAVHPMGIASPFFRTLPLTDHGLEWIHPPLPMAHPFDDGTAAVLDRSLAATADSLGGAGDARAYMRLMKPFVDRWQDLFDDALAPPIRVPRNPLLMARFALVGLRSAVGLGEATFAGERARAFFAGIAGHALLPLDRSPSAAFGLILASAAHGMGWPIPRGGSQRIAAALASYLATLGGDIVTGARVTSLAELPPADAVMLNLTPRQVLAVAGGRLPARYARALRRYRYAPGVFKVDWALSEPIPWTAAECRRAGTIHLAASMAATVASAEAAWYGRPDEQPYVILTQPSLFDPTRAPAGKHTAWAYCHVPNGSATDFTAAIERQVERFAPGFRDIVLARHTISAAELERYNPNMVGGDINGGVQDVPQFLFRPVPALDPYATPVDGIFICSASTPPGGAVHGMCGYWAARSALRLTRRR